MKTYTFWSSLVIDGDDVDVEVEYACTPFVTETYYQPAEGGEVFLISVILDGDDIINGLSDDEQATIIAKCEDRAQDDILAGEDDDGDYRYELARDRMEDGE